MSARVDPGTIEGRGPLLSVRNLSVEFSTDSGTVYAVNDVSFDVAEGEALGIVGESGSGKSVTMQALLGLLRQPPARIRSGQALFRGRDLLALTEAEKRRIRWQDVAMVFQDPMTSLNPVLTVGLQLTEALVAHKGLDQAAADAEARAVLDFVGIANAPLRMAAYPHQFSGGQLQRIGIAMALICRPSLLIADEPTTALDVTIQAQIVELVVRLQKQLGMAIIWISHDLALVAGLVDRVAVMYGGRLVEEAPVARLFGHTAQPYTRALLRSIPALNPGGARLQSIPGSPPNILVPPENCAFAPRCGYATERCRTSRPPLETIAPQHRAACFELAGLPTVAAPVAGIPAAAAPAADELRRRETLLCVADLKVHFPIRKGLLKRQVGSVRAVDGVSFEVFEGETLALVGESGCGKSTTGRAILGLLPITQGKVVFQGRDYTQADEAQRLERTRLMQMVFQNPYSSLNPRMTVGRIIGEGLRAQKFGPRDAQQARILELLDLVGLPRRFVSRYPFELSGGQRQRVGIARALAASPRFIVADEPISALDVSIQAQIVNLLEDLKVKLGLTYLFIGHDLSMIRHISDRVAVMYLGRIVEMGVTDEVFHHPRHPYTRALLSAVPQPDPAAARARKRIVLPGSPPDPSKPPPGCRFHPRCPLATDLCRQVEPGLVFDVTGNRRGAACHFAGEAPPAIPPGDSCAATSP
jgi:peptide/nickel transport system ATP-binding protein